MGFKPCDRLKTGVQNCSEQNVLNMKYELSIRITLPEEIAVVIRQEKQRFVTEYQSSYKSEPHITLYLDSYTKEGFGKLVAELQKLQMAPFTISLLAPMMRIEKERNHNLYFVDIQGKERLRDLHDKILEITKPYRSLFLRDKTQKKLEQRGIHTDGKRESLKDHNVVEEVFDPHITVGEIALDKPQVDIEDVRKNLCSIEGKTIVVSSISSLFYGKEDGEEKFLLLDEIKTLLK